MHRTHAMRHDGARGMQGAKAADDKQPISPSFPDTPDVSPGRAAGDYGGTPYEYKYKRVCSQRCTTVFVIFFISHFTSFEANYF